MVKTKSKSKKVSRKKVSKFNPPEYLEIKKALRLLRRKLS